MSQEGWRGFLSLRSGVKPWSRNQCALQQLQECNHFFNYIVRWETFYFPLFSCVFYYLWTSLLRKKNCRMFSMQYALVDFYDKLFIKFYHAGFLCADICPACTKLLTIIWWPFHHPIGYMAPKIYPLVQSILPYSSPASFSKNPWAVIYVTNQIWSSNFQWRYILRPIVYQPQVH